MSAPKSLTEFATPIADSAGPYANTDHPRFAQIQCHLEGTHPDVRVGQVWEDLDPRKHGRHVLVNAVNTDGTTDVTTIFIGTVGARAKMGQTSNIATHLFRVLDGGRGFRLRAVLIPLTDAGVPVNLESVPTAKPLSSMLKVEKPPVSKPVVKTTTPPAKTEVVKPATTPSTVKPATTPSTVKPATTPSTLTPPSTVEASTDTVKTATPPAGSSIKVSTPESAPKAATSPIPALTEVTDTMAAVREKDQRIITQGNEVAALLTVEKTIPATTAFHARLGVALVSSIGFENAKEFAATVDPEKVPAHGANAFISRMVVVAKNWKTYKESAQKVTVEDSPSKVAPATVNAEVKSKALVKV